MNYFNINLNFKLYILQEKSLDTVFFISCVVSDFLCYLNLFKSTRYAKQCYQAIKIWKHTSVTEDKTYRSCILKRMLPFCVKNIIQQLWSNWMSTRKKKTSWKSVELNPLERCSTVSMIEILIIMFMLIITKNSLV